MSTIDCGRVRSAGHVAAHPAVRVRAARRAGAARAALPPPGARAARAAAPAGQHEPHHQLLRHQAEVSGATAPCSGRVIVFKCRHNLIKVWKIIVAIQTRQAPRLLDVFSI